MSVDGREFRSALGRFATGVTVITAVHLGRRHGMTANAFMSVSLAPPLVAVSVGHQARIHALLEASGEFGVSVLREDQEAIARHFAGHPVEGLEVPLRFRGDIPLVAGAIAQMACRLVEAHPAGDHTIFLGEATWLEHGRGMPLLFHEGRLFGMEHRPLADDARPLPFPLDVTAAPELSRQGHTLVADYP